jgi:hypothetical protein
VIIHIARRHNHEKYEEMNISENDDIDDYIPTVTTPSLVPAPTNDAESPYVLCTITKEGITPITK